MTYTWRGYSSATPMPYDFLALQYLYGARAHWSSDDRYAYTTRGADQYVRAGALHLETPYRVKQTLWDTGGVNTLDLSALPDAASGYRIDLRELGWSCALSDYISGFTEFPYAHFLTGTALAPGVRIARVVNSSSSDTIYAGSGANSFAGYAPGRVAGEDTIYGATGDDTLDLRPYRSDEVTQIRDGNDLVLNLDAPGSRVRLSNYYAGNTPAIRFAGKQTFIPYVAR
jgi:serralysin